jgi:hypothetical protein
MQSQAQIFFVGNCQVRFLAALFEAVFPGRTRIVGTPFTRAKHKFCGLVSEYVPEAQAEDMIQGYVARKIPVVTIRQASPLWVAPFPTRNPSALSLVPPAVFGTPS